MGEKYLGLLQHKFVNTGYEKLIALNNKKVNEFVGKYIHHCNPDMVFVRDDSATAAEYIKKRALELGEEKKLSIKGHTVHFDGPRDQGRDKSATKYLLAKGQYLGSDIQSIDREEGLDEINGLLKNSMIGKEMYVCFFCLGPLNSQFSILAMQITDSSYVAHSEHILMRDGYEQFKKADKADKFFRFIHSAGILKNNVSRDIDKRKVYIDLNENIVYSVNTQYAGNSIGLKKLAMRLAIKKASQEGWLTEHMFIMGVKGPNKRKTYFSGSFPSACGKTATCMLDNETIVGDDIAYLRKINNKIRAVNVERGIFGIIKDLNSKDDSSIYKALNMPGEVIFSNILVTENGGAYWIGKDGDIPVKGINYAGLWHIGLTNDSNEEITPSHKNARYTIRLSTLKNKDENIENPNGVELKGIIYGGRDSDTSVPVEQAFDWAHGILTKAATIESETTAATLGEEGVRKFNLMANLDFLSIPMGKYVMNNVNFIDGVKNPPTIFSVNYFLKDRNNGYIDGKLDKHIWLKWMELRVNNEVSAIKTPTGYIPKYQDLKKLFKDVLGADYPHEKYIKEFTMRIPENLAKIERIVKIYKRIPDEPEILFKALREQEERLKEAEAKFGKYIEPEKFPEQK